MWDSENNSDEFFQAAGRKSEPVVQFDDPENIDEGFEEESNDSDSDTPETFSDKHGFGDDEVFGDFEEAEEEEEEEEEDREYAPLGAGGGTSGNGQSSGSSSDSDYDAGDAGEADDDYGYDEDDGI